MTALTGLLRHGLLGVITLQDKVDFQVARPCGAQTA